jgi:hypothetical protein
MLAAAAALLLLVSSFCGKLKASSATNNPQPSNRHDLL